MMMYVNWFDRFQPVEHEQPTVGIILCSEKNDAAVKITMPRLRGSKVPITAVVADIANAKDPRLKKAIARVRRAVRSAR
jgi:hypothetical protein